MDSYTPKPRLDRQRANERPHILVVTDDPDLTSFLTEGLPLGGFWVSVIANGLQALEVFRLRQFDLVVLDADMQSFDAIEFLRRLRGASTLDPAGVKRTEAPVVILTTTPMPRDFDPHFLGVKSILQAPLELEEIVVSLHQVFQEWREANPHSPLADSANLAR